MAVPLNVVAMWDSTVATIPTGWTRVTDMDDRHPKGTATGVDPNVTGGSATHGHGSPNHQHSGGSHAHAGSLPLAAPGGNGQFSPSDTQLAVNSHTHNYTTGAQTFTSTSSGGTWNTASSNPSSFRFIFVESDGTPQGLADGMVAFFNSRTPPSNWIQHVGSKDLFPLGAAAAGDGGGTTGESHAHTGVSHTHPFANHDHPDATSDPGPNFTAAASSEPGTGSANGTDHTHNVPFANDGGGTSNGRASGATSSTTYEPTFSRLLGVENDAGVVSLPNDLICMWLQTLASIPASWNLCDGTKGTPDLRDKFIRLANVGGDVGATGGTAGHDHTDPAGHTHGAPHTHAQNSTSTSGSLIPADTQRSSAGIHSHGAGTTESDGNLDSAVQAVDNNADTQPAFRTVAYIQFQAYRRSSIPAIIGI